MKNVQAFIAAIPLILVGCSSVSTREAFAPTKSLVQKGAGVDASWPETTAEKAEQVRTIGELLRSPLTTDSAAKIAVLNNPALRSTFEELRISQADLLQASRLENPTLSASVRWPSHEPRSPNSEFGFALELFNGLLIPLRRNFAKAELEQVQRRVASEVFEVVRNVKSAMYTLEAHQLLRERM